MPTIHNRGKMNGTKATARKIIYPKEWGDDGKPVRDKDGKRILTEVLLPGQHKNVTQKQFEHIRANCPDEIVNLNDVADMQAQFKPTEAEKPREGYLAPDEVEARVAARVKEEMDKQRGDKQPAGNPDESREEFIARLDAMDRGDLIAVIEQEELDVAHKNFKAPGALKAAILSAIDAKEAAKAA